MVLNHTVKKIGSYSYFFIKLTLLKTSAALRRLRATAWRLRYRHEALPREFDHFLLYLELFYSLLLFKFFACCYCSFYYYTHNHKPSTRALPHKSTIEDEVVLIFEELMLPCRHTKNSHSS